METFTSPPDDFTSFLPTRTAISGAARTRTAPSTTLFFPASQPFQFYYVTATEDQLHPLTAALGSSQGSTTLDVGFDLYFGVTATTSPAQVSVGDYVWAVRQPWVLPIVAPPAIFRSNGDFDSPATTDTVTLESGDTLFIPFIASYPATMDLSTAMQKLSSVSQTPLSVADTSALTMTTTWSHHIGAVVGGVIGGLVGMLIIILGVFLLCRRRRAKQRRTSQPLELSHTGQRPPAKSWGGTQS